MLDLIESNCRDFKNRFCTLPTRAKITVNKGAPGNAGVVLTSNNWVNVWEDILFLKLTLSVHHNLPVISL